MQFRNSLALILVFFVQLLTSLNSKAQELEKDSIKKFSIFPFPVVYYAPETRFVFGAGGVATFRFKNDSASVKPSSITAGAAYTQNKQILLYATYQLFLDNNKYYVFGEAGYYKYSYFFFGTGKNEVPKELYKVDYPRIKTTVLRRFFPHFYAGLSYQYENYNIKSVEPSGALSSGTIPGAKGSTTSGLGLYFLFDSRDSVFFPTKGWFAQVSLMNNSEFLGSSTKFNRIVVDVSRYSRLYKNTILVLNSYNSFVHGAAPFQQQSQLGGNKQMRGYYQGRFTDYNLMAFAAEARFPIYRRFGGVAFANLGALGDNSSFIRTNELKYSYGLGLRFAVNRKDHLNLRLDYALGPKTSGIYFTVGEAF